MPELTVEELRRAAAQLAAINDHRSRVGLPPLASLNSRDNRKVQKLSHEERCEMLAFIMCGVPTDIIATVMEVTRQTVSRMRNCSVTQYPREWAESMNYNSKWEFCAAKITEGRENTIKELYPQYSRPAK